ncbi:MAG TPA: hypothetical protein PKG81_07005, partial [Candidatus Omnitrophota bacterium]|nr:hypothetical protein [Candidatus Omnitrophota bacterium]
LTAGVDPEVKRKFADVLSWHKKYRESIIMYDELIKEGAGETVLLQKARVLGWAREYEKSLKAYDEAYQKTKDDKIKLEMEAKDAYWSARVKKAISKYNELIKRDFQNVEAMFDLSQVYSYQRMWGEARSEYEKILGLAPAHFRAKEGLEKTDLISKHIRLDSSYDYFESDSQSRDSDIRRHSAVEKLYVPINDKTSFEAEDWMTERMFSDFSDVFENRTKLRLNYANGPDWWIDGMYTAYTYSKGINTMHNFGGSFTFRAFDLALFRSSYERERLENSSEVIRGGYYKDTFMERVDMDLTQRLKLGGDYSFSSFHPENSRNLAGGDVLYYFSFDPLRFTAKYRYSYDEYNKKVIEYFSPKGFTTNTFSFNWRHYLNKNGMFFGANDIYYEAGYDVSVDSTYIASHRFSGGLYWDITKSFAVALNGFITNSSVDVYKERRIIASLKYYF